MTTFTPGPWLLEVNDTSGCAYVYGPRGDGNIRNSDKHGELAMIGLARDDWDGSSFPKQNAEDVANARLIAAAPDLYENLARMVEHFETWASDHSMEATAETWSALHCARAALAKVGVVPDKERSE